MTHTQRAAMEQALKALKPTEAGNINRITSDNANAAAITPIAALAEPAPSNSLPDWSECAMRVGNSDFIAKRVAEGGYGPEADSKLASALHRFIYEYDDKDSYRSGWFMHRLENLINEISKQPAPPADVPMLDDDWIIDMANKVYCAMSFGSDKQEEMIAIVREAEKEIRQKAGLP